MGVEYERTAVEGAKQNLARGGSGQPSAAMQFVAGTITAANLPRLLPRADSSMAEWVLLDPPRHGTDAGVVGAIAARKPVRVLHIFCGIDEIPREVRSWREKGYGVERIVPLDMFPGTPNLEVLLLLLPSQTAAGGK